MLEEIHSALSKYLKEARQRMSGYEQEPRIEGLNQSKVELTRNAKGDSQWNVRVSEGTTEETMNELRRIAVSQHFALGREVLGVDLETGQIVS